MDQNIKLKSDCLDLIKKCEIQKKEVIRLGGDSTNYYYTDANLMIDGQIKIISECDDRISYWSKKIGNISKFRSKFHHFFQIKGINKEINYEI